LTRALLENIMWGPAPGACLGRPRKVAAGNRSKVGAGGAGRGRGGPWSCVGLARANRFGGYDRMQGQGTRRQDETEEMFREA